LAIDEAIKQESLKVLDIGAPKQFKNLPDGGLSFMSVLTIAPEFQLPEYKGIQVTVPTADVPEADLDAQLKSLQERFADFNNVDGRGAAMGDYAVIDYTSSVDGKPTEEFLGKPAGYIGGREGFWVKLDEKSFLPGFAEQLTGMKVDDAKDISITLPEDFPLSDIANKEIVFHATLKELKEAVLPELNDEMAERLAPGKTMEEIKDIIRDNMQHERQRRINDMKVNQIVAHLVSKVEFELPEQLVNHETQGQADAMVQRGIQSGMSEDEIASQQAELFASASTQAVSNLRTNFILQEIAIAESLQASDSELVSHLAHQAQQRKIAPKKFIKDMQSSGRLPSIRNSIVIGKAIDFLVKEAKVEESDEATLA
jgi:trigger factor